MMNEMLMQGEYAEIIIELLKEPYGINSVPKVVFLAFCVRNEGRPSYRNRKRDFAEALLGNLTIRLLSHPEELMCIFEVLAKLRSGGWIRSNGGRIEVIGDLSEFQCDQRFLSGCKGKDHNPIIEVNRLDDRAFLEEVLRHV